MKIFNLWFLKNHFAKPYLQRFDWDAPFLIGKCSPISSHISSDKQWALPIQALRLQSYHQTYKSQLMTEVITISVNEAPVPLSIFRSNSKFDENSERSSFKYIRPITTIFCTRHDSDTVVTCAKYRCDRPRIFHTRVFWIFIEFRIRSKYA